MHMTVVARANVLTSWRVFVLLGAIMAALFAVLAVWLVLVDPEIDDPVMTLVAFPAVGFLAGLGGVIVFAGPFWVFGPMWARYEVQGTRVLAYRFGRIVRDIDIAECTAIRVEGLDGWAFVFRSGPAVVFWDDLPQIVVYALTDVGPKTVYMPRVLDISPGSTNRMRSKLKEALLAGGVEESKLERLDYRRPRSRF